MIQSVDDVEVIEEGVPEPTSLFGLLRQEGIDSVEPIVCDDASGVILNSGRNASPFSNDVVFDGNQIVPTQAYTDDIFERRKSAFMWTRDERVTDKFRCEPTLSLSIVQDGNTGVDSSPNTSAAQACGVTVANSPDNAARTVILNDDQTGFECVLAP